MINKTLQVYESDQATHSIKTTNIRLLLRNEVNNWDRVGFFILTYKAKRNVLASLHELIKQNTLQTGRSFCEIAKNSAQVRVYSRK